MGATIIEPRPGRIPFVAIDRYAVRYGIAGSAFDMLCELLSALDGAFVEWEREQAEQRARARG